MCSGGGGGGGLRVSYLIRMIYDRSDFLGVALQDGDHLLRVLVEYHSSLVVTACQIVGE